MIKKNEFKSGYVALLGKPNVGKSTLLNYFLKQKLSIVCAKPQTTRQNILGIVNTDSCQIIFVDTPGVHHPKDVLGKNMLKQAVYAGNDADQTLVLLDAVSGITANDRMIFKIVKDRQKHSCLSWTAVLFNKIDLVKKNFALPLIDICRKELKADAYIPISARTGCNLDLVLENIIEHLPAGSAYYPLEQLTDKNERYIIAELIREQALEFCLEEVPHCVAVTVEAYQQRAGRKMLIRANIFVERSSQKMIIIGKNGAMLKQIGTAARQQIEDFLDQKIYLQLWVKVHTNWRKDKNFLEKLKST